MNLAQERKKRSEEKLQSVGIEPLSSIPAVVEESQIKLRTPEEVAKRAIILYALMGIIFYEKPEEIVNWIKSEGLWNDLSPQEQEVFSVPISNELSPEEKAWKQRAMQSNLLTWRIEALQILLWCLGKLEHLEWPEEKCDGTEIRDIMPGLGESTKRFIAQARLRPIQQLLDCVDLHYRLHMMMQEQGTESNALSSFDTLIVYERIHALAWLVHWHEEWDD